MGRVGLRSWPLCSRPILACPPVFPENTCQLLVHSYHRVSPGSGRATPDLNRYFCWIGTILAGFASGSTRQLHRTSLSRGSHSGSYARGTPDGSRSTTTFSALVRLFLFLENRAKNTTSCSTRWWNSGYGVHSIVCGPGRGWDVSPISAVVGREPGRQLRSVCSCQLVKLIPG